MQRREFLSLAAAAAAVNWSATSSLAGPSDPPPDANVLEHQRRLVYWEECRRRIRKCLRERTVINYRPGQVVYNLGEYPCRKPWNPNEWDDQQLEQYSRAGIEVVQVHEDWSDSQRLFGADKFSALNEKGFLRFVEMCHRHRLKIIPYISTGYFERNDPDFRPEWATSTAIELYFRYARCSPASAGWRAYLLPKLKHILDHYGVDGFYNDVGYSSSAKPVSSEDEGVGIRRESVTDAAFEDLLGLVYDEVHRRGGIVKVHAGFWYRGTRRPPLDPKLYDYLWVGETAADPDQQRETLKDHPPYLVPCIDVARTSIAHEDDLYLHSIPYLQFPVLMAGRPVTGERAMIPGVQYCAEPKNPDTFTRSRHMKKIWDFYQKHPDGPYSYGWWDSCPGRREARPVYYRWLKLYRAMTEPGTHAFLEVTQTDLVAEPLPDDVRMSVFANRELYLVLANYSTRESLVTTADPCTACSRDEPGPNRTWRLQPRSLVVVKRVG